jgi:hypothetical protein
MMTRSIIASLSLSLTCLLLSGCGDNAGSPSIDPSADGAPAAAEEATITEESADVETSAVVLDDGTMKAVVVVEKSTPESELTFVASTEIQTLTATVVSVDLATRDVVLVGADGVELELVASDKTSNLDQVSPGDTVNAQFMEQVTIQLVKGDELKAQGMSAHREVQAAEGDMPARAEVQETIDIYTVVGIDLEANTFVLRSAAGELEEFAANDPANLAKATVGDSVVVSTTVAMAVEVVKATAE